MAIQLLSLHYGLIPFTHPCMDHVCLCRILIFPFGVLVIMHCANTQEVDNDAQMMSKTQKTIMISAVNRAHLC